MFKKSLLAISLTMIASSAFANRSQDRHTSIKMVENQSIADIPFCGGSASVFRSQGTLEFQISEAHNCSNIFMNGVEVGKLKGGQGKTMIGLAEQIGPNKFTVRAQSGENKSSATFHITSYRQPIVRVPQISVNTPSDFTLSSSFFGLRASALETCGGQASIRIISGSVYLYLIGMQKCSEYDILTADGQAVDFPKQPVTGAIRLGADNSGHSFKMVVRSQRGNVTGNYDVFRVTLN